MTDDSQSYALTPTPLPQGEGFVLFPSPAPGEGSIVTEMAVSHFRKA
jgi:hypothetical protein